MLAQEGVEEDGLGETAEEVREYLDLINDFIRNTLRPQQQEDPSPPDEGLEEGEEAKVEAEDEQEQPVTEFSIVEAPSESGTTGI